MSDYIKLIAGIGLAIGGFLILGLSGYPVELIIQSLGLLGVGIGISYYLTRNKKGRIK